MRICLLPLALLAGCGGPADEPVDNRAGEAVGNEQVVVPAPPAPLPLPTPTPTPTPSPTPGSFAFAGDWAVSEFLCENKGVWSFTRDRVVTDGHTACQIDAITGETAAGATLEMSCTAEGTASKQRWELTAADQGRMTVVQYENGELRPGDVTLQRCG